MLDSRNPSVTPDATRPQLGQRKPVGTMIAHLRLAQGRERPMTMIQRVVRGSAAIIALGVASACSGAGGIGDVLGGVLGGGQPQTAEAQGAIRGVDTRAQQISLQLTNGQSVALAFDNQTKVVYQNQLYAVTNLDPGDRSEERRVGKECRCRWSPE